MNTRIVQLWSTVVAGLLLMGPSTLLLSAGGPHLWAPIPVHLLLLAFLIGPMAVLAPTLLFWARNRGLFKGSAEVPRRSFIAFGVLVLLSILNDVASWSNGLQYQGRTHTIGVGIGTVGFFLALAAVGLFARRRPSWRSSLVFHWLLFLWLGWYAIPYLGELR